ncbi:MAG: hypothetical protein ACPHK8_06970, partial [Thermoplasmatota archaeon]
VPAMAQPDHASDRRDAAREKADAFRDHCKAPENDSVEERCQKARDKAKPEHQARREAHHLHHAIDALYKRVGKLEMMEYRIQEALDGGNLTDNETAEMEAKLDRIEMAQEKAILKIREMQAKMDTLKERHDKVRDHVDEMRAKRGDHKDADEGDGDGDSERDTEESDEPSDSA